MNGIINVSNASSIYFTMHTGLRLYYYCCPYVNGYLFHHVHGEYSLQRWDLRQGGRACPTSARARGSRIPTPISSAGPPPPGRCERAAAPPPMSPPLAAGLGLGRGLRPGPGPGTLQRRCQGRRGLRPGDRRPMLSPAAPAPFPLRGPAGAPAREPNHGPIPSAALALVAGVCCFTPSISVVSPAWEVFPSPYPDLYFTQLVHEGRSDLLICPGLDRSFHRWKETIRV